MTDYDDEAREYDASRGGEPRARAAAKALQELLPQAPGTVLDLARGTGVVARRLRRPGRTVLGVDRSDGMLELAARRVPRGVIRGDATRLPLKPGSVDAMVIVWLLRLLPDPTAVLAEAARVLRPGAVLVTTVDKDDAYFVPDSDMARITAHLRERYRSRAADGRTRVRDRADAHGPRPAGETVFPGAGQGRSPRRRREVVDSGRIPWCAHAEPAQVAELCRRLAAPPEQDRARPDPLYRLLALEKTP
ncbi:methyltransferase domain-containing protein [Streptomyces sp. NPDC052109]|uniref:class I SAM-dependent methyltransferase n=1 Tax=Streptomyces sp. NPDC052109 TaxID=3155527 RepID=UPI0034283531